MESEESTVPLNYTKSKQTSSIFQPKSQVYFNNLTTGNKGIETAEKVDKVFKYIDYKLTSEDNDEEIK